MCFVTCPIPSITKYFHTCFFTSVRDICSNWQNMFLLYDVFLPQIKGIPNYICLLGWGNVIWCLWHFKMKYLTFQNIFLSLLLIEDQTWAPVYIWGWCYLWMGSEHNSLSFSCYVIFGWHKNLRIVPLYFSSCAFVKTIQCIISINDFSINDYSKFSFLMPVK